MKKYFLLIGFLMLFMLWKSEISATISNIKSISNPDMRFKYDRYLTSVLNYEDRLIVSNDRSIEEFYLLPDGNLEQIGYIEKKSTWATSYIDEDKYYYVDIIQIDRTEWRLGGLFVYDLTKIPMELYTYVKLNLMHPVNDLLFFSNKHIMISDYRNQRSILICKETFKLDGYAEGLYGGWINIRDNIIIQPFYLQEIGIRLIISEISGYEVGEEISYIDINDFDDAIQDIVYDDSKIIIVFGHLRGGLVVIDYSDINNPFIYGSINRPSGFYSAQMKDNLLFTHFLWGFTVWEYDGKGGFQEIFVDNRVTTAQNRNIQYIEPYIYVNTQYDLRIYDVSNDFKVVNTHGYLMIGYPGLYLSEDEIYYMEMDFFNNEQRIYSVLDKKLICVTNYDIIYFNLGMRFEIKNDRLYWSRRNDDDEGILYIYKIENQNATLLNSINIGHLGEIAYMLGNRLYIQNRNPNRTTVFNIIGDELIFLCTFDGIVQSRFSFRPTSYIINLQDNTLLVRDIDEPMNVLFKCSMDSLINESIMHLDDGYFVSYNYGSKISRVFAFDIYYDMVNQIAEFESGIVSTYNGILSVTDWNWGTTFDTFGNYTRYYTVIDDELVEIGAAKFDRDVMFTYFFPERSNMVQIARTGIVVHDFEYETLSEDDISLPVEKTELLGNFPNPFNPETTIEFIVRNSEFGVRNYAPPMKNEWGGEGGERVTIDIYNIRGQKVRSLLDGLFESGSHTVVWDGRDDSGRELGSGVYLYRMVAGEDTSVRKMVLLK